MHSDLASLVQRECQTARISDLRAVIGGCRLRYRVIAMSLSPRPPGIETAPSIPKDFRIGDRVVQPQLNRIRCGTRTLQLEPKIMRVLLRLAERPGEVVTKERLFQDVWEGNFVTEDVLTRAIGEL